MIPLWFWGAKKNGPRDTIHSRLKAGTRNEKTAGSSALLAISCFLGLPLILASTARAHGPIQPAPGQVLAPASTPGAAQVFAGAPIHHIEPAQDAWSIQRRLESLPDAEFEPTARTWVQEMGEPARSALLLCAGSTASPGLTISGRDRRVQLSERALAIVAEGLQSDSEGPAWRSLLTASLAFGETLPEASQNTPLAGQGALAAINVVAGLQLVEFSDLVAAHMLPKESEATQDENLGRGARWVHAEAQLCLFQIYGVWFSHRDDFQAFPKPPAGQVAVFREAFAVGAARESKLALELLEVNAESGQALLLHPDPALRTKAVERLIRAVGEQTLSPSSVRESLAESVLRESSPHVSDAMLQGLLDLALAAGAESQAVHDLRITLQSCARGAPISLVPSLLSAFDRLPRPVGEAGREVAVQDGASACQLLESLWNPVLRLDRDTTILTLRAWSRVQTKLNGFALSADPQRRAGALVLRLMADPSEPERVRLVAAEALAGWPLDLAAMQRILRTLSSLETSANLRRAAYPLALAGVERLDWNDLDGSGLIDCVLRDMGHADVDLRAEAVRVASNSLLLDRISAVEAGQGRVLETLLGLLEAESSPEVRTGLMDLIIPIAEATPRPDLLVEHLKKPEAQDWVASGGTELAHLARIYQTLAGPGQGALIVEAALGWLALEMEPARIPTVRNQALEMALTVEASDAQALSPEQHRALYEYSLQHLLESERSDEVLWSQAHGNRLLTVHIAALQLAPKKEEDTNRTPKTAYLEAKLLASAVVEEDDVIRQVFNLALGDASKNWSQQHTVMRDMARYYDSVGNTKNSKSQWNRLSQVLAGLTTCPRVQVDSVRFDFDDLGKLTAAADRIGQYGLACEVWRNRVARPAWKAGDAAFCLGELYAWAQVAEKSMEPGLAEEWVQFVESRVQVDADGEGWLKLPEADLAPLGERAALLRGLAVEWKRAREVAAREAAAKAAAETEASQGDKPGTEDPKPDPKTPEPQPEEESGDASEEPGF